jgi:hypothetical protein
VTREDIDKMITYFGLDQYEDQLAIRLFAEAIDNYARSEYQRIIQLANDAASHQDITSERLGELMVKHRRANR